MKFKHAVVVAALALGAAGANAVTGPIDISSGSAGFSNSPLSGPFVDLYTFTVTTPSIANGSVTAVVNAAQDVDFTSIVLSGPSGPFSFSMILGDPIELWALPAAGVMLGAGAYTLTLTGTNSVDGGSYGGNIAITPAAAIPEPESYALMLAGLGVVGSPPQTGLRYSRHPADGGRVAALLIPKACCDFTTGLFLWQAAASARASATLLDRHRLPVLVADQSPMRCWNTNPACSRRAWNSIFGQLLSIARSSGAYSTSTVGAPTAS